MEKNRPTNLCVFWKKISLLMLMVFMGSGVVFSQTTITVTTDTDAGIGSLRQAIVDAADGDLINFDAGVTTIKVGNPLLLGDKTLTIDGGGTIVLDGALTGTDADTFRVVTIFGVTDKVVTIKNLTIQNGYDKDTTGLYLAANNYGGGGLIANNSNGGITALENCTFKDNQSFGKGGGARVLGFVELPSTITNCNFINNKALDVGLGDGGGLDALWVTIDGCEFTGNHATDFGGGAVVDTGCVVTNCIFTGNSADDDGGGLRSMDLFTISDCTFDSNESADRGGGICINSGGTATNLEVINNTSSGDGGGVYINNPGATLTNSLISGNSTDGAKPDGGGLYVNYEDCYVANCTIINNHSADMAGGVMIKAGVMENCIISGNTADDDGGGVYIENARLPFQAYVIGCVISNNSTADLGGGVVTKAGYLANCIVTNNYAANKGGGVRGIKGPWFLINTVVYGNTAVNASANFMNTENTATLYAANCAFDVVGTDDMPSENIFSLAKSPFIGGSGEDSLQFPDGSLLLDAGTTEYGLADTLSALDLIGNPRLDGPIDLGPYEKIGGFVKIDVTGVTLDQTALTIDAGTTGTLLATVAPENASIDTVQWSSDNEAVATVADGVVTGVAAGTANISVKTNDGDHTATCAVTVNAVVVAVTGVSLDQTDITLDIDATATLLATVAPAEATDPSVTWSSDAEGVATVAEGVVTAVAEGTAVITVTTTDGEFKATCSVTVNPATIAVTGVSLDQTDVTIDVDATTTLVATVSPAEATDPSVTWSSDAEGVATVADGVVTGVADGTATITVTTTDGEFSATCTVTVQSVGLGSNTVSGINLYPNPVTGQKMFIELSNKEFSSFEVYNALGVMIHRENVDGRTLLELNIPAFKESGYYFIKMTGEKSIFVERFIVQ